MTTEHDLIQRTKRFALRIIKMSSALDGDATQSVIARQLLRAGTSVGANYRAACRARSTAEFIAKLGIVEEEADETIYWLELVIDAGIMPSAQVAPLLKEANELLAITVASKKTARIRKSKIGNRNLSHST